MRQRRKKRPIRTLWRIKGWTVCAVQPKRETKPPATSGPGSPTRFLVSMGPLAMQSTRKIAIVTFP
jgi:hypothetical protein